MKLEEGTKKILYNGDGKEGGRKGGEVEIGWVRECVYEGIKNCIERESNLWFVVCCCSLNF